MDNENKRRQMEGEVFYTILLAANQGSLSKIISPKDEEEERILESLKNLGFLVRKEQSGEANNTFYYVDWGKALKAFSIGHAIYFCTNTLKKINSMLKW